ncbi:MAG: hypothetical protein AB7S26_07105 [Sandaracinaceae bacterium]
MSEVLELRTAHRDIADLVEDLAPSVDQTSIELPTPKRIEDGEWVRFDVQLADGSTFLEGLGRATACVVAPAGFRVRLSLLQFDTRNEIMFERMVLARESLEIGVSTGKLNLATVGGGLLENREPATSPPPPPRGRPAVQPRSSKPAPPAPPPKSAAPPRPPPLPPKPTAGRADAKTGSIHPPRTATPAVRLPPTPRVPSTAPGPRPASVARPRELPADRTVVAPAPTHRAPIGASPTRTPSVAPLFSPARKSARPPERPVSVPPPAALPRRAASVRPPAVATLPGSVPAPAIHPSPPRSAPPPAPLTSEPTRVLEPQESPDPTGPRSAPPPEGGMAWMETAPHDVAGLETVISRASADLARDDGLRLQVSRRVVAQARILAAILPSEVIDTRGGQRRPEEAVLHAALRLGLAALSAMGDDEDDG